MVVRGYATLTKVDRSNVGSCGAWDGSFFGQDTHEIGAEVILGFLRGSNVQRLSQRA